MCRTVIQHWLGLAWAAMAPLAAVGASTDPAWIDNYGALLRKHVTAEGLVRYAAWKGNGADVAALTQVVKEIGASGPGGDTAEARLAFYLNAYNAWILHRALAKFPTKGVLNRDPLFFKWKRIRVGGKRMSFEHLEHGIIRKEFHDARVHFALNCASRGCPPMSIEPFHAATLDGHLDRLARSWLDSPGAVRMSAEGDSVELSQIFEWYADDFEREAGSVVSFINRFRTEPIPVGAKVRFFPYDWALNQAPE